MVLANGNKGKSDLEKYFHQFRTHIVGVNQTFQSPYGEQKLMYLDWTASFCIGAKLSFYRCRS